MTAATGKNNSRAVGSGWNAQTCFALPRQREIPAVFLQGHRVLRKTLAHWVAKLDGIKVARKLPLMIVLADASNSHPR